MSTDLLLPNSRPSKKLFLLRVTQEQLDLILFALHDRMTIEDQAWKRKHKTVANSLCRQRDRQRAMEGRKNELKTK